MFAVCAGLIDYREEGGAGLFAASAGFGANSAVLVHVSVLFAFSGAFCACGPACFNRCLDRGEVLTSPAAKDSAGRCAKISTVKVETDAVAQVGDHLFC